MNYQQFLESKQKAHVYSGFDIDQSELNPLMFDFQKFIVQRWGNRFKPVQWRCK